MVAIVSGSSLGLSLSSLEILGQRGTIGTASQGRNGELAFVNAATGNLVLQSQDDRLVGRGPDVFAIRTYNSLGQFSDDNGDNWAMGVYAQQLQLTGTVQTAGSSISRTARDGAQATYTYDTARSLYVSTSGSGAYDTVAYDEVNNRFVWLDGDSGLTEHYENSAQGRLLSSTDANGNTVNYSYNGNGTLSSITTANGESTYFDYSGTLLTSVRTVVGGVTLTRTRYAYDASSRLASVTTDLTPGDNTVADGVRYVTSYTYDGSSKRVASITQSDGTSLAFTYVQVGADYRVATVTDGSGTTSFSYDIVARKTSVTNPLGQVTVMEYDSAGQLTKISNPAVGGVSSSSSFVYNGNGDVLQVIDGEGRVTEMTYDANGNQLTERDAAGNTVTRTYSAQNQLLTETIYLVPDPDGAGSAQPSGATTTRYVYDSSYPNRLRFELTPDGQVLEHRYNSYGERTATIRYLGTTYDVSGLGSTVSPAVGALAAWVGQQTLSRTQRTDTTYDARGQVQSITTYAKVDSFGNGIADGTHSVHQFVYSRSGELLQTIAPDLGLTSYTYDGLGRLLTTQNALNQSSITSYDDANRRTTVTQANGLISVKTYDSSGRLISVAHTDAQAANFGSTQYFYDAAGRLRMTQDATGVKTWLLYDDAGLKVADIDGNGTLTEYVYDKSHQVTQTIVYSTAVNVSTLVNGSGQPTNPSLASIRPSVTGQDRKSWNIYDAANRLVKTVDNQGAVTETVYDGASHVVQVIRFVNTIATSGLGAAPASSAVAPTPNTSDRVSRHFYSATGLLTGTLDAEGYLTEYQYNAAGQRTREIRYATSTTPALRATGTLEQLRPSTHAQDVVTIHILNGKGQVAGSIDAEGFLTEFVYDANGNTTQTIRYATALGTATLEAISVGTQVGDLRPATKPEDRTTTRTFDKLNRVTQETNPEGTVTQYVYDDAGNLVSKTLAAATAEVRTLTSLYDKLGRLVGELSGIGSALLTGSQTQAEIDAIWAQHGIAHIYDAVGRRTSTTDALGQKTLFFYDVDGRLTHTVNPLGEVVENQYNTLGQLTATIRYGTRITTSGLTGVNAGGLVNAALTAAITAVKNATLDSSTTYSYAANGAVATSTDALGNATTYGYNTFGDVTSLQQAIGSGVTVRTLYDYDRRGRQISSAQDPAGINATTSAIYDAFGRITSSTDANGNVHQFTYDRLGRTVSTTDPSGGIRSTTYDAFDRLLTRTDAQGRVTSYVYSKVTRSVTVTTPEGIKVTTITTRLGQTLSVTDGNGNVTTYGYDKNGNLLTTTRAGITTETKAYDRANRLTSTTDGLGRTVALTYDAANRILTRTVDPGGLNLKTVYQYDAKGQQISMTDPNGVVTQLVYDLKGQLIRQVIDPSGLNLITQYTFDGRGKTLTVTSPNGSQVKYTYDKLGRRIQEQTDPNGLNLTRSYAYDKNGNVVTATDPAGAITRYAYDAKNQLVYTVDPLGRVQQQSYDAEGRVIKTVTYTTAISLSSLANAPTVAQVQARIITSTLDLIAHRVYDKDGRLSATVNALGEVTKYTYNGNGYVVDRVSYANRITMAGWTPGTVPAPTADAARDSRQRTVYDAFDRAVYTIDGLGAVVRRKFDVSGNLTEQIAYAATVPASTAATTSALASAVTLVANATRDQRTRYVYDNANRVAWVANGVGAVTRHVYDGNGNVVKTVQYATAVGAAAAPSSVSSSANDRIKVFAYDKANRQTYSINALGAVTQAVYDKNGNVTQRVSYANTITPPTGSSSHTESGIAAALSLNAASDRIERMAYDAANRLVLSVDALGAVTETSFDAASRVVQSRRYAAVISTSGLSSTATEANIRARLTANATDDRIERYTYDAAGQRIYTVDSMGHVTMSSYDGRGLVSQTRQYALAIPAATANTTAAVAAALVVDAANDRMVRYAYDAVGRVTTITDPLGFTESYSYDGLGQKLSFTNKKSAVWTYGYDAAGRLIRETSPQVQLVTLNSGTTLSVNEAQSGLASVVTAMAYDALGNLTSRTEAQGRPEERTTQYEYDALGRQVKTTYPMVGVYVPEGASISTNGFGDINGAGYTAAVRTDQLQALYTQVTYDTLGNAVANRDMAGNMSYKTHDLLGRVVYDVDALGYVSAYSRNVWDEVTQLTRYSAKTTLTNGNPAKLTTAQVYQAVNPAGGSQASDRILFMEYDRLGRTIKVTEPQGFAYDSSGAGQSYFTTAEKITQNSYNSFGDLIRVASLRNQASNTWVATNHYFDKLGRETATVDTLGYLSTQAFDAVGNLVSRTEFKTAVASWNGMAPSASAPTADTHIDDRSTLFVYDRANRKVSETRVNVGYSDATTLSTSSVRQRGNLTTSYGYDALGNQTRVTDAAGAVTYTYYDALGRVIATAAPPRNSTTGGTALTPLTEYRRDAYGNALVKIDYAQGASAASTTSFTANTTGSHRVELFKYDTLGHQTQSVDAMGVDHYKSYNAQGLLAKEWQAVTGHDGNTQTLFRAYEYDKLGRQTAVIDPASTTRFLGNLSCSFTSATKTYTLPHTLVGNNSFSVQWTSLIDSAGGNVKIDLTYNTLSTLSAYAYDESGNPILDESGNPIIVRDESGNPVWHGVASHSVTRSSQEFTASAVAGGASWSWANASSTDGGISSVQRVKILQKVGTNWVVKWEGAIGTTQELGVALLTQVQAGTTRAETEYNAFGEVARQGVDGGRQEYFHYDNTGNLWRTNAGDGIDKVYLYDLQGNRTAQIQSAGSGRGNIDLTTFATAEQISALTDVRRTDIRYDALGRVVAEILPERLETQGGVAHVRQYAQFSVSSTATRSDTFDENGQVISTTWPGTNTVSLAWASLAGLGSGDIKVEFDYVKRGASTLVGATFAGYDEAGKPVYVGGTWVVADGQAASRTQIARADQAASGTTISWNDPSGNVGGINRVTGLRVYKKDLQGSWVQIVNQNLSGYKGNAIEVAAPTDPGTSVQLQIRPGGSTGSTGWSTVTMTRFDSAWRYDASGLAAGSWEYRVLTTPQGGTTKTTAGGTLTVAAPPLAVINSTRTLSAYGYDMYSWAAPSSSILQTFRVRPAGSSGAWTTLTIGVAASGYSGVSLAALSNSSTYDYELLWTQSGQTIAYAHAVGQITIGAPSTGTRTVSYQVAVQGPPVISGYDEAGQPIYARDESGNIIYTTVYQTRYRTETYAIPRPYTATTTTAPNTTAVSQSLMSAAVITQLAGLNGTSAYARPTINKTVDRWGNVTSISDPRSANWVTTFSYDANNQLIEQLQPDAQGLNGTNAPLTQIYYDKLGRQIALKDANGQVNGQVFDAGGQLSAERHADGGVVTHAYNAFGYKVKTTDARGNATTYDYDKLGRLLTTTSALVDVYQTNLVGAPTLSSATNRAIVETNTWDQAGRKLRQTNGNGETTKYTYDLRGNILRTTFPLTQSALTVYDNRNRKVAEIDANGNSNTWTYDHFGLLTAHTDLAFNRYTYTYDHARQLIKQTNTLGLNKSYQYDAAGQLTRISDAQLNHVTSYAYDRAGNHVQETTTQGGVVYQDNQLAYDALGRLRWVGDSKAYVSMEYDLVGNRTRIYTSYVNGSNPGATTQDRYFKYDAMNRQTVVDAVNAAGDLGSSGHAITYDLNGNRRSDTYWGRRVVASGSAYTSTNTNITETYTYDTLNRLLTTTRDGTRLDTRFYDGAHRVLRSGLNSAITASWFDALYGAGVDGTGRTTQITRYDANGRVSASRVLNSTLGFSYDTKAFNYDAAGNLLSYQLSTSSYTNTYSNTLLRRDAYKQARQSASSTYFQPGSTTFTYDAASNLTAVTDATNGANNRTFVNDAAGRILAKTQGASTERQLIVNGEVLARFTASSAEFTFGYRPISGSYPAATPGVYTVSSEDSLRSIAKAAYGDSSLWYLVAEANGLGSDRELRVGQTLTLPTHVQAKNSASTFRPYDPTTVIGDTSPNLPSPPPREQGGGCGGLGQIIMVVVAVVASVYTAGALTAGLSSSFGTIMSAGASALSGGAIGVAGTAGVLAGSGWAAAAIGGAVGSIASQVAGNAMGVVDGFSWKGVALGALSAGVTSQLPVSLLGFEKGTAGAAIARAVVGNTLTQGVGVVAGLQPKFDWKGVAASAVGALAGNAVGGALGLNNPRIAEAMGVGEQLLKRTLTGVAAGTAAALMRGGRVAVQQIATDAFGNALGSRLVDALSSPGQQAAPIPQGAGPWSDVSYRNGSDVESDRVSTLNGFMNAFSQDNSGNRYPGAQLAYNGSGMELGGVSFPGDRLPSMFPDPQVTASGRTSQGLTYEDWSSGARATAVPQPDIEATALEPFAGTGGGLRYGQRTGVGLGDIGVGLLEMGYAGLRNQTSRIAGGFISWGVLAMDGLDAAVQYQQAFNDRWGYVPDSDGAHAIMRTLAPVGQAFNSASQWVRGYSERYLGDAATSVIGAAGQFALEAGTTVTGLRTVGSALDSVAVSWGSGVPTGGLYSLQAGGVIVPEIRFVSSIRNDIMSALPEGASLVQTTRGGAAVVRFADDAFYNIPMQSNAAAYSRVFSDVRAMDTMGSTFTDVAQGVRNRYGFEQLSPEWKRAIGGASEPWQKALWESNARGTFVHEGVADALARGKIPGGDAFEYMRVGPDLVPRSGLGLKYEITQQTPSLNAIIEHSRRYPNELLRYVTYK